MPVDPQVQMIIDGMNASGVQEFAELGHVTVRELCESMLLPFDAGALASVEDKIIHVNGTDITARVYVPLADATCNKSFPVVVYFHGGGWTIGSLDTHDPICRALASWTPAIVVSVHYRRAPEFPFPIPLEDCYAATLYVQQHAQTLLASDVRVDASRLAVAGDSAGGNLATVVCLLARDRATSGLSVPKISYQVLLYPIVDCDLITPSYRENATGYVMRASDMKWFWDQYIRDPAERQKPYASPLLAGLKDLPPAYIVIAQHDTLRDEGNAYARKLRDEGVYVTYKEYPGMIHGFIGFASLVDKGREALKECAEALSCRLNSEA
jgi:acetyl esterase